ncbi:hypothetical protein DSM112329_04808 [Paraconexibacter sp. AEG42_29]|uniref:Uncharacterized protein n=1 Tax=Paraconexibacter sp. AEG42_29 TaxID=2997339 RepID=A0AAU7B1W3_9ACTN
MTAPVKTISRCSRLLAVALVLCVTGCGSADPSGPRRAAPLPAGPSYAGTPQLVRGLKLPARVQGEDIALAVDGGFAARFWGGVNLGATLPGTFPGQLAPSRADYDRWLAGMGELGVRVLRVYTILPPRFYEAIADYDRRHAAAPIYLLHGVWIPEDEFVAGQDAFAVLPAWKRELRDAVDVVHGDADLPRRRGHASGRYRADISRWVMGWSLGVEWDPAAVAGTNRRHAGRRPFRGRFVRATRDATPMESFVAAGMDHVARLEARRGWSRPLTFTNWLTTDPLRHPSEPLAKEDRVSVDAMHIRATRRWPGGTFASYHAYPYYPDFLRYEHRGDKAADGTDDPYAGYLRRLRAHHRGTPMMITEFGVPSSLGSAHRGPLGRDQGGLSEQEAGRQDAMLLRRIREERYAGGILFEWADEWFKFTWNTLDLEQPAERRALWRNALTNEEHFGLVAVEPGLEPSRILDGDDADWTASTSQSIAESRGPVAEVRAAHDAEYLWLRIRLRDEDAWKDAPVRIGLGISGKGNRGLPGTGGADPLADHAVTVGPGDRATLLQAAWLDPLPWLYGITHDYVAFDAAAMRTGSGAWNRPRQILNRPLTVPGHGRRPAEFVDRSTLGWGTGDPSDPDFDSRRLVVGHGRVLELRLPWSLLGYGDPSSHAVLRGKPDGTLVTRRTGRLSVSVQAGAEPPLRTAGYDWEDWSAVPTHERRKAGWEPFRRELAIGAAAGPATTPGRRGSPARRRTAR